MPDTILDLGMLERVYQDQLALVPTLIELTLLTETPDLSDTDETVRGVLRAVGGNAGRVK
jgi:hypothetical protein